MEKTVSVDERIRRAEEIYNKRKMQGGIRVSTNTVNSNNRTSLSLFKRMILKILICAILYFAFYIVKNSGMFFSQNVIEKTQSILAYDMNIKNAWAQAVSIYNDKVKHISNKTEDNISEKNQENNNEENSENTINEENVDNATNIENGETAGTTETIQNNEEQQEYNNQSDITENELGIGGADTNNNDTTVVQKSQMEVDAEYIKANFSFIKPVTGIVTSRFGPRTPTEVISANHEGIDIGASSGTAIYASVEGTVKKVSSYGDYGKHLEIENGDVVTLYAHCSKINVSVGQYISQGQKIAEVGSTGRATGPHLHFEIQRESRVVNPELVLEF